MNELMIVVLAIVGVVGLLVGVNYLQGKGWFNKSQLLTEKQMIKLAQLVVKQLDFKGKKNAEIALDVVKICVDYIDNTLGTKDVKVLMNETRKAVYQLLAERGIVITDDVEQTVEYGVQLAFYSLPDDLLSVRQIVNIEQVQGKSDDVSLLADKVRKELLNKGKM